MDPNREQRSRFHVMTYSRKSLYRAPLGLLATVLLLMFSRVVAAHIAAPLVSSSAAVSNDAGCCTDSLPPGRNQDPNDVRSVITDDKADPRPLAYATVPTCFSFTAGFDDYERSSVLGATPFEPPLCIHPVYLLTERFRL